MQDALASDAGNTSSTAGHVDHADPIKSCTSDSVGMNNINFFDTDMPNEDGGDGDDDDDNDAAVEDEDDVSIYDDDCYNFSDNDGYAVLQSQFDNVDLPPGVEASFSWFNGPSASETIKATKTLTISDRLTTKGKENATSSLTAHAESSSNSKVESNHDISVMEISRFDVVDAFSDHHYAISGFKNTQVKN